MSNPTESSTAAVRGFVASDLNVTSNTTCFEATCLSANRINYYLTDSDLPVPHASINQQHVTGGKTVAVAVFKMKNKLQDFDAAFYHNYHNEDSE
ncbi:uncharacterized protein EAF01_001291 [Botrytis porri]|uniref:Uncharacterized protein n=1 Tax=Botrytis porri TaxID=87229 RepID=A0A4Z1KDQ1_9HELO|nr:uncharacterized protein EAF01_001291 [Botrytis porri]KAF7912270.1 hypothetical protein EAF01_001291 [Botrytis porri]TGO83508.1 hypothetical protein BPOR_0636g00030 [Botrytis porri]